MDKLTVQIAAVDMRIFEEMVHAFRHEPNVQVLFGGFENLNHTDAMVSAANSFGIMDGGVDFHITEYFGRRVQDSVQDYIKDNFLGEQPVGTAFIVPTGKESGYKWLIHSPTMRIPSIVDHTDAAYYSTRAALLAIYQHNRLVGDEDKIKSVCFPAMCTGCGRMSPERAAKQMALAVRTVRNPIERINWDYAYARNFDIVDSL